MRASVCRNCSRPIATRSSDEPGLRIVLRHRWIMKGNSRSVGPPSVHFDLNCLSLMLSSIRSRCRNPECRNRRWRTPAGCRSLPIRSSPILSILPCGLFGGSGSPSHPLRPWVLVLPHTVAGREADRASHRRTRLLWPEGSSAPTKPHTTSSSSRLACSPRYCQYSARFRVSVCRLHCGSQLSIHVPY